MRFVGPPLLAFFEWVFIENLFCEKQQPSRRPTTRGRQFAFIALRSCRLLVVVVVIVIVVVACKPNKTRALLVATPMHIYAIYLGIDIYVCIYKI